MQATHQVSKLLMIPLIATTQNAARDGKTHERLSELFHEGVKEFEKIPFSAAQDEAVMKEISSLQPKRNIIVLWGCVTEGCILNTALDLLVADYKVLLVVDAVSSFTEPERRVALKRMMRNGVSVTTVESLMVETVVTLEDKTLKQILELRTDPAEREMPDF